MEGTDRPMANISLVAKFEVRNSLRSDAIVITTMNGRTDGRTDRHSSNVLEFRADQMSSRVPDYYFLVLQTYWQYSYTNRRIYLYLSGL